MGGILEVWWSRELAEREGTNLVSRSKSNPSFQNQVSVGLSATISRSMDQTRPSSSSSAHRVSADKQVENIFEALISKIPYYEEFCLPPAMSYVPAERNIYITERCIEDDGLFCSCTPSTGSSRACYKACQCGMSFSCCSSKCKCADTCANKSFQHRPHKKTKLIKQIENVFEQLGSKIASSDFDPLPLVHKWNVLGHYEPIKRNVYHIKRRIEDYGISCSCTPSSGSPVTCDRDCQCGMLFSCCSSSCKCDNTCANKAFQHRPLKNTKLIQTEKCGYGLLAEDEIKKGEFVIEYVGEVIDDRTCELRLWRMRRMSGTNFYLCEVSSNMVIDATDKGNMSRFINHSCEPNTEMQKWTVDGETRVGIFALRDIKKGEELTYDYKFVQFGADQDCHCGSSNCRKMLGSTKSTKSVNSIFVRHGHSGSSKHHYVKKKKRKTKSENCIGQFLRLWHPRKNMYVGCWIIGFDQETKIHTLQFGDLHTETFDLEKEEWHFLLVDSSDQE